MLTKRVCFVLGAGASMPYGFPSGGGLLELAKKDQPDEWWTLAKASLDVDKSFHAAFVQQLLNSGLPSLDHFAGRISEYKDYTKALIAYYIGKAEFSNGIVQAGKAHDWCNFFIHLLADGVAFDDLPKMELDVVTFNFDRSFEEALLIRLSTQYKKTRQEIANATAHWNVVHVHGSP